LRAQATHNEANGGDIEWALARPQGFRLSTGLFFNRQHMIGDRLNTAGREAQTDVWSQVTTAEVPLIRAVRLMAGYRADHDTNFGARFSPQAALAWRVFERLSLSVSATRGLRAPDFNELYILHTHGGGRVRVIGDPSLRPQQSWSFHTSAMATLGSRARMEARLFHNDMTDLIQTTMVGLEGSASVYRYGNVGRARIRGGSMSTSYAPHRRFEITGSYQYLDTLNRDASTLLEYAPRHRGSVRATWSAPRRGLLLSVFGNATSATYFGVSAGKRSYMEAFEQFGFNAEKDLTNRVTLRCTLRNLTDDVSPGYRLTAPRGVEASLRFKLGRIE
jgi:outer membrane receptor for ferrienterochelin and colicin